MVPLAVRLAAGLLGLAAGLFELAAGLLGPATGLLELAAGLLGLVAGLLELAVGLLGLVDLHGPVVLARLLVLSGFFETGLAGRIALGCRVPRKLRVRPSSAWRNKIGAGVATSERTPTIDGIFFFGAGAKGSRPILKR